MSDTSIAIIVASCLASIGCWLYVWIWSMLSDAKERRREEIEERCKKVEERLERRIKSLENDLRRLETRSYSHR